MLTYLQAIILGIVQGVTELFPVSSLGRSVLIANLFGLYCIAFGVFMLLVSIIRGAS